MEKNPVQCFSEAADQLVQLINGFNNDDFNKVPFQGSWTAGMVAQHLFLAMDGMADLLKGDSKIADRPFDKHVDTIREILTNMETKMDSPGFIFPETREYDPVKMSAAIQSTKDQVMKAVEGLDLERICTGFELPGLGQLTRMEAIWFSCYHIQRHNIQLTNIRQKLS